MPLDAGPRVCAFLRGGDVLVVVPLVEGVDGADFARAGGGRGPLARRRHRRRSARSRASCPSRRSSRASRWRSSSGCSAEAGGHTSVVGESGWMPEGWEDRGPATPDRLPRRRGSAASPSSGYDRDAVQRAFDAFYRHAAQLDATLRVLESMEIFARQAGDLRADLRALRAASWGPLPAARPAWRAREERVLARGGPVERGRAAARARGGVHRPRRRRRRGRRTAERG